MEAIHKVFMRDSIKRRIIKTFNKKSFANAKAIIIKFLYYAHD